MSIRSEYVEAIERYGYTPTEARFLYLVGTHSGYSTQQQFFRFAGVNRGGMGTRLTVKALEHGHIRNARLARHTLIYNLFARPFYESIEKDNLRNRRRLSDELIRTRLLILDFVLAHPDLNYLETEHEKVRVTSTRSLAFLLRCCLTGPTRGRSHNRRQIGTSWTAFPFSWAVRNQVPIILSPRSSTAILPGTAS